MVDLPFRNFWGDVRRLYFCLGSCVLYLDPQICKSFAIREIEHLQSVFSYHQHTH